MIFRIQQVADPALIRRLDGIHLALYVLADAVEALAAKHAVSDEDVRKIREQTRNLREQQTDLDSAVHQGDRPQPKE